MNAVVSEVIVDKPSFFTSLFTAPFIAALYFFWLIIPAWAVIIGYLPFVFIGGPLYYLVLMKRGPKDETAFVCTGVFAVIISPAFIILFGMIIKGTTSFNDTIHGYDLGTLIGFYALGIPHAILWGAFFRRSYLKMTTNVE